MAIVNGYFIKDETDKEEILDVLINVMSSNGMVVNYKLLKSMSVVELLHKLKRIGHDYNAVVYETDINHNTLIHKAKVSDNGRIIEYNNKNIVVESISSFISNINERLSENNKITSMELDILNDISKNVEV